jgi:hypothetical protein
VVADVLKVPLAAIITPYSVDEIAS